MKKFFGTDGIRQEAEKFTPNFLQKIAEGLAKYGGEKMKVLIGGDTRESSEWIINDLEKAFEGLGIEYGTVGVLPTPAINYVFFIMGFDFAIDVTASHNPYYDNGIKIFERGKKSGQKLSEKGCQIIEAAILAETSYREVATALREDLGEEARELYVAHLKQYIGKTDLSELKIGLDCANGATSVIGERVFRELGANVKAINIKKQYGKDINVNCGSTHLEKLRTLVKNHKLDFGVAFDGDGDRVLMVDETGTMVDGDQILAILAKYLGYDKIATTVMANQGLLNWGKEVGVEIEITAVGDQNIAKAMREKDIPIGGEQSGHIIMPGEATGDGMLTALMMAKIIAEKKQSLTSLSRIIVKLPQILFNLEVESKQKEFFKKSVKIRQLVDEYEVKIRTIDGRMLVRPSGTENIIRVTMWGKEEKNMKILMKEFVEKIKELL